MVGGEAYIYGAYRAAYPKSVFTQQSLTSIGHLRSTSVIYIKKLILNLPWKTSPYQYSNASLRVAGEKFCSKTISSAVFDAPDRNFAFCLNNDIPRVNDLFKGVIKIFSRPGEEGFGNFSYNEFGTVDLTKSQKQIEFIFNQDLSNLTIDYTKFRLRTTDGEANFSAPIVNMNKLTVTLFDSQPGKIYYARIAPGFISNDLYFLPTEYTYYQVIYWWNWDETALNSYAQSFRFGDPSIASQSFLGYATNRGCPIPHHIKINVSRSDYLLLHDDQLSDLNTFKKIFTLMNVTTSQSIDYTIEHIGTYYHLTPIIPFIVGQQYKISLDVHLAKTILNVPFDQYIDFDEKIFTITGDFKLISTSPSNYETISTAPSNTFVMNQEIKPIAAGGGSITLSKWDGISWRPNEIYPDGTGKIVGVTVRDNILIVQANNLSPNSQYKINLLEIASIHGQKLSYSKYFRTFNISSLPSNDLRAHSQKRGLKTLSVIEVKHGFLKSIRKNAQKERKPCPPIGSVSTILSKLSRGKQRMN